MAKTYSQFMTEGTADRYDLENRLIGAHYAEVKRKKGELYNDGKASSRVWRLSTTSKGSLYSEIDPHTKKVTHEWDPE